MRHQLKPKNPSARARMCYILRSGRYGVNQSRVDELVVAGVANLPSWAKGPEDFWAGTDGFERANARLSLELELNLPRELSREGQVAAIADYIARLTAEAGKFPITWGIHDDGGRNVHCHLMLQERPLDGIDRDGPKGHFKRANKKKPLTGGVAKSEWWHKPAHVFWSRALWADACNQALLREGHIARFDPRRKSERLDSALRAGDLRAAAALCTQTERHEGVRVAAARKKLEGGWIEAADLPEPVTQIINGNDAIRSFNNWLRDWSSTATDKELELFLADHLHELHRTLERELQGGHIQVRAHVAALAENAARDAEQAGELELLTAAQIEAAERTAELAALVSGEQQHHATDLGHLVDQQAAQREELALQLLGLVASGRAAGWLEDQVARELVELVAAPQTLDWLGDQVAELVGLDAAHRYREWRREQDELAELVAGEEAHQSAELHHLADRQALERHDARMDQARAKLAALASAPQPTAQERRADELEQDRGEWLQAHPVRARLGLVPAAVSQDAIDRARAAAVAAADELKRQIDQAHAQLTAWLDRAERQRREQWPGEYQPPLAREPQVAQEQAGSTLRDSLDALQERLEGAEESEWLAWEDADDWEQVQEPEPEPEPEHRPRGPRMR